MSWFPQRRSIAAALPTQIAVGSMGFSYRHCAVDPDWIFVEARLRGTHGDPATIARRMAEIRQSREATQPIRARTGGSTFKNPPGDSGLARDRRLPAAAAWCAAGRWYRRSTRIF